MNNLRITIKPKKEVIQYYMHNEDQESDTFDYHVRDCALGGCPAVFPLRNPNEKVEMDKYWQFYLIAINPTMDLEDIASILHYRLAFANGTGLGKPLEARRNYILGKDINAKENPRLDKDRTCSRNLLTGVEVGENLLVKTMDGNNPPPLKPGKVQPERIQDIRPQDYRYLPEKDIEMFVVANTVSFVSQGRTSVAPFPRGGYYDWTNDKMPYTFLPLVSRGIIEYPLHNLTKLPLESELPSAYRIADNQ